jgi:hypothetical protein
MGLVLGSIPGQCNCLCAEEGTANGRCGADAGAGASISRWDNDNSRRI